MTYFLSLETRQYPVISHSDFLCLVAADPVTWAETSLAEDIVHEQPHQREGSIADMDTHAKKRIEQRGQPDDVQAVQEWNARHRREGEALL